jgi:hypothetical protein
LPVLLGAPNLWQNIPASFRREYFAGIALSLYNRLDFKKVNSLFLRAGYWPEKFLLSGVELALSGYMKIKLIPCFSISSYSLILLTIPKYPTAIKDVIPIISPIIAKIYWVKFLIIPVIK